jgi:hypothetical protein
MPNRRPIFQSLLPQEAEQFGATYSGEKPRDVVTLRNPARSRFSVFYNETPTAESTQVRCGSQSCWTCPNHYRLMYVCVLHVFCALILGRLEVRGA